MLPLMVTSTPEFNNSVYLNPRRKAETALQKSFFWLTLMKQNFRCCTDPNSWPTLHSDSYWHNAFGQMWSFSCEWSVLLIPGSCPHMESQVPLKTLSSSVIRIQHLLCNAHETAHQHFSALFKRITARKSQDGLSNPINATNYQIHYSGKSEKACIEQSCNSFPFWALFSSFPFPQILI